MSAATAEARPASRARRLSGSAASSSPKAADTPSSSRVPVFRARGLSSVDLKAERTALARLPSTEGLGPAELPLGALLERYFARDEGSIARGALATISKLCLALRHGGGDELEDDALEDSLASLSELGELACELDRRVERARRVQASPPDPGALAEQLLGDAGVDEGGDSIRVLGRLVLVAEHLGVELVNDDDDAVKDVQGPHLVLPPCVDDDDHNDGIARALAEAVAHRDDFQLSDAWREAFAETLLGRQLALRSF